MIKNLTVRQLKNYLNWKMRDFLVCAAEGSTQGLAKATDIAKFLDELDKWVDQLDYDATEKMIDRICEESNVSNTS